MAKKEQHSVTMRVRIGDNELEVTGPINFVENKIAEFREQQKATTPIGAEQRHTHQLVQTTPKGTKGISTAQFFKKISPKSEAERILAAGYYLEKFQNAEKFTAKELAGLIKDGAKTPPPRNPNDVVNGNIKRGLMMPAGDKDGKMAFVLTSDGEETIESSLNA